MAESEQQLSRVLSWKSGAFLGLSTVLGIFVTIGFMVGLVGAWAVIFIWAVCMVMAAAQAFLYAEMATMFPSTVGGSAAYAHEAFRKYTVFVGPVVMWGYWLGWSLIQAVSAYVFGSLIQAQWFPSQTWGVDILGTHVGLPHILGGLALISVYVLNAYGIKPAARLTSAGVTVFVVVAAVMVGLPFVSGTWSAHELTWRLHSWQLGVVLVYLAAWTCFAAEGPSLFAPEYKKPGSDTPKAIKICAVVMVAMFTLVPLATSGAIGEKAIGDNPSGYAVTVMQKYWHGSSSLIIAILAMALWVTILATSAQSARALLGLARSDATIKQFAKVNRHKMPGRALAMDILVNLLILFLVGNTVAIVGASNFGYIISCSLISFGYVLLRRDRPNWPRPYKLPRTGIAIALLMGTIDLFLAIFGVTHPALANYGGAKESIIAVVLLFVSVPLFLYRRVWQDRGTPFQWREDTPVLPDEATAALLHAPGSDGSASNNYNPADISPTLPDAATDHN
ncbi:APC family permease [Flexivirga caeni]|uniref:APC family permease n=1 Tax=Flexivirga caeni TaxID=2294115 RepID=A0A3M9MEB0_9MICO|nr:APC family permease [Flexivirga caeni]RNI22948.1 APC family permease [Flexivirga caeni]